MSEDLFTAALHNLKTFWGFDQFRPGQDDVVKSVLDGKQTVVLFPTGGGKSLCYQVPATVLPGLTLVISPLVALMQDQVDQLVQRGIKATFINSTLKSYEVEQRLVNARNGMYTLLYCAPERLETNLFRNEAPNLNIQLVAVDEAHCISEWGHDFRPHYRRIRANIEETVGTTRWMVLTATATPEVRDDIIKVIEFDKPNIISKGFERKNLKWWVDVTEQKHTRLLQMVTKAPGSGLVYAGTRRSCNELAELIRGKGIKCEAYHAGLSSDERKRIQQQWIDSTLPVVVATNAFGMGIDKPDCRWVIHFDMSYSLEAYYQEAGRAGRDGAESYPTLLVREADLKLARKRLNESYPDYELLQHVYNALCDTLGLATGSVQDDASPVSLESMVKRSGLHINIIRSGLRILNRLGVIEANELQQPQLGVQFLRDREGVANLMESYSNEAKKSFMDQLVRTYAPEAWSDVHYIDRDVVTGKMQLNTNSLVKGLDVLQNEGILRYSLVTEDPLVHLCNGRTQKVPISRKDAEQLRTIQLAKLEHIIGYAKTSGCRSLYIRKYFGEEKVPNTCGFCDRCVQEQKKEAANFTDKEAQKVLSLIAKEEMSLEALTQASKLDAYRVECIVKWLNNERRVRFDRKKGTISVR